MSKLNKKKVIFISVIILVTCAVVVAWFMLSQQKQEKKQDTSVAAAIQEVDKRVKTRADAPQAYKLYNEDQAKKYLGEGLTGSGHNGQDEGAYLTGISFSSPKGNIDVFLAEYTSESQAKKSKILTDANQDMVSKAYGKYVIAVKYLDGTRYDKDVSQAILEEAAKGLPQ